MFKLTARYLVDFFLYFYLFEMGFLCWTFCLKLIHFLTVDPNQSNSEIGRMSRAKFFTIYGQLTKAEKFGPKKSGPKVKLFLIFLSRFLSFPLKFAGNVFIGIVAT